MIPNTTYQIISAVNREADLARPPMREYRHTFGAGDDRPSPDGYPNAIASERPGALSRIARVVFSRFPRSPRAYPQTTKP